jgi:hypothetical protein
VVYDVWCVVYDDDDDDDAEQRWRDICMYGTLEQRICNKWDRS